jgi:hypothetical protein
MNSLQNESVQEVWGALGVWDGWHSSQSKWPPGGLLIRELGHCSQSAELLEPSTGPN